MAESMTLIPVRTSRQGTSLNAGKLKPDYRDETSTVEIHKDDMSRLGLQKGDKIRMTAENGMEAIVSCKDRKGNDPTPGLIFMAYGPTSSLFMDDDTAGSGMPLSKHLAIEIEGPLNDDGTLRAAAPIPTAAAADNIAATGALLGPEQSAALQSLLASPMTATQAAWISGYFAALSGQSPLLQPGAAGSVAANTEPVLPQMTVLYGSQTGNGEGMAESLNEQAVAKGFNSRAVDMLDFEPDSISQEQILFIIVSTHGEGDPPIAAEKLHEFLHSDSAPKLDGLKFAVFALGDSSYEFFCQTGKDFDSYLEKCGAERILDRVDSDIDFEEPAEEWIETVLASYQALAEQAGGPVTSESGGKSAKKDKSGFSKTNPYPAEVLNNYNLNGEGSSKETRHVEIDLADSGLSYEPGDALGVYPLNNPVYVDELIAALKMDPAAKIKVGKETLSLRDAFIGKLDITALSRVNMEKYADLINSDDIRTLLDTDHKEQFSNYTWGRQILDLVEDYPAENITEQQFVDILRKIPGRLYSIASSLAANPGQVHLLVGAVRYHSFDRDREGVCSTFLAGRMQEDEKLAIYVQANKNFRLPESPDTPVIMVGPGTGLAPFCAFLQERQATQAGGKNWLFFGDQHQACDYLYGDILDQFHADGLLTHLSLAFSRDQEQKIYVQTRILEQSAEIYQWLEEGAHVYICGDASRMANDVHEALIETIMTQGEQSRDQAVAYLDAMIDNKRYQRDVY